MIQRANCHPDKNNAAFSLCRECYMTAWRKDNRDHIRKYNRTYNITYTKTDVYRANHRLSQKLYALRNPEKVKAQQTAHTVRQSLSLLKVACERCFGTENLHMHHPDYTKPTYVLTLCKNCHNIEHGKLLELAA